MANTQLDEQFVEEQRGRLEELKQELLDIRQGMNEDEQDRNEEEQDTELDSGDEAQQMFTREMDATIGEQTERRLQDVERALGKIEEGSYGVCEDTGEEIAKGRLEAVPEAIRTMDAQQRFEQERRPAGGGEV